MTTATMPANEPVLRTLAPLLRRLEKAVRQWLDGKHLYPRTIIVTASLEGLADDLGRQAAALDVERPLLVIMFMGGTGVGKSSTLNALAGGAIAQASWTRPTTRDPVVYYHDSVKPERFDPALRLCHLASHDRPALEHKIIVDTPDVDSTEIANRDKLLQLLPVADIVFYVGSPEKYHDQLGWDIFKAQRKRKAFAFIMNKWDRAKHGLKHGVSPDEDWLADLKKEGFENPQVFRIQAQYWVDKAKGVEPADELYPGEQFLDLVSWLEQGLNTIEIEAIKGRGITTLLQHLIKALEDASPPDLTEVAGKTRAAWERILGEEAHAAGDVLLNTLEPYQDEIEHHFTVQSHRQFRGPMALYLGVITKLKYAGLNIRDHIPFLPKPATEVKTEATWDVATFTRACSKVASERSLDARNRDLANRLETEADKHDFPLTLIAEPTEAAARIDWRQRYADALIEVLTHVEKQWSKPKGVRRIIQLALVMIGNFGAPLVLFAAYGMMFADFFNLFGRQNHQQPELTTVLLVPLAITLIFMTLLYVVVSLALPLRWNRIRNEFHKELEERLRTALCSTFAAIPQDRAEALNKERKQSQQLVNEVKEVAGWLDKRQTEANIRGLYGN